MDGARRRAVAAQEQDRRQEGAQAPVGAADLEAFRVAGDAFRFAFQLRESRKHLVALRDARERTHADAGRARVADDRLRELRLQCRHHFAQPGLRHDRLADRGALLAGLDRHLARDFLHEERELRRSRPRIRSEDGGIERVRLGDEAHGVTHDGRMRAKLRCGRRRTRERDDVLAAEVVEQVADAAADELQGSRGQDPGLDDPTHDELGQVAGRRRGLDDCRHAGEQRWRELLEHAPDREIECIDMHGRAFERHAHVLADEAAALRQRLDAAVQVDMAVRQLTRPLAREHQHRADAAVDVDPGIALGRAGRM